MKKSAIIKVFILMHCIAVFITNPAFCESRAEIEAKKRDLRPLLYEEKSRILVDENLPNINIIARKDFKWYAILTGPGDTPYAGGTFIIVIRFPIGYPIEIPQVNFLTKIYHPNVNIQTGEICLDILQNWSENPKNIHSVLLHISLLFYNPMLKGCLEFAPEVASDYIHYYNEFKITARIWTKVFAEEESEYEKIPNVIP